jgi:hypothetical protein
MSDFPEELKKRELASLTNVLAADRQSPAAAASPTIQSSASPAPKTATPTTNATGSTNAASPTSASTSGSDSNNLWNKILDDASRSVRQRLEPRSLVILGNRFSGKSSLLARLQRLDINEVREGIALDYAYIDIFDETATRDDGKKEIDQFLKKKKKNKNLNTHTL